MPFKYKVISLSISITLGVIFSVLFVYWLNMDINNEQRLAANQHIIVTDAISNEVNTTLDTLNTFVGDECSPEMMVTLRRAMFKSVYIKDIGYVDNAGYLKCTTGLGTLKSAILEEGEDYISKFGAKIWVAKELMFFNKLYKSIVVQKKNYNVVVDAKDLNKGSFGMYADMASLKSMFPKLNIDEAGEFRASGDLDGSVSTMTFDNKNQNSLKIFMKMVNEFYKSSNGDKGLNM